MMFQATLSSSPSIPNFLSFILSRHGFTMLGELRQKLPAHVVWFGCSATLDFEAERLVLRSSGFRPLGLDPHCTQLVHTTIDQLDLSFCVCPIPNGYLSSCQPLYFLLNEAVSTQKPVSDGVDESAHTQTSPEGMSAGENGVPLAGVPRVDQVCGVDSIGVNGGKALAFVVECDQGTPLARVGRVGRVGEQDGSEGPPLVGVYAVGRVDSVDRVSPGVCHILNWNHTN
jgi:hypothetical protein